MRFSRLHLENLPLHGVIGIEGPNESGKTTIGEALLFAFFGKTRKSLELAAARLIRWEADYMSVEVEFTVPARGDFLIYREIDKYGTNFVKIIDSKTRRELAAGNINVTELLNKLLRYDFHDFHQSFYLDQHQEILGGDSQEKFLERMVGLAQIQEAANNLGKENEQLEREYAHYQKDVQRNLQQIGKYEKNILKLGELKESARRLALEMNSVEKKKVAADRDLEVLKRIAEDHGKMAAALDAAAAWHITELRDRLRSLVENYHFFDKAQGLERDFLERNRDAFQAQKGSLEALEAMAEEFLKLRGHYQDLVEELAQRTAAGDAHSLVGELKLLEAELRQVRQSGKRASWLFRLSFLLAAALLGLWGLLFSGTPAAQRLLESFERMSLARSHALLCLSISGSVALLASGLFFFGGRRLGGRARHLAEELSLLELRILAAEDDRKQLSGAMAVSEKGDIASFIKTAENVNDLVRQKHLQEFRQRFQKLYQPEGEKEYRKGLREMVRSERDLRAQALKEIQRQEMLIQEIQGEHKKLRSDLDRLENDLRDCESQSSKKDILLVKNEDLELRSREIFNDIECRRVAIDLLRETAASIRNWIGPALSRFVRGVLPRLTRNRYREVKLDEDFALKLFTSEKSDFLELAELSGGTLEALRLALRLAFSQTFIGARTRQPQFIFLDEPFKMIDAERTYDILSALRDLSPDIQQFFVVQPNFTSEQRAFFDRTIITQPGSTELVFKGNGAS
ncbi:MAG: AAA family ATPase [Planctomycetes bacterium]|nr:AAA family ATPase [Planctomycetota bacterium]